MKHRSNKQQTRCSRACSTAILIREVKYSETPNYTPQVLRLPKIIPIFSCSEYQKHRPTSATFQQI